MIIYLDQNKWIELARMHHKRDESERASRVLEAFERAIRKGEAVAPLSALHYIEMARVSNADRRARLGETMWRFSQGRTLAAYRTVVKHELELALSKRFPQIRPTGFRLLGRGCQHAFGVSDLYSVPALLHEQLERALLVGEKSWGIDPPFSSDTEHQRNFLEHLRSLHARKEALPKSKWDNLLHAISVVDIMEPLKMAIVDNDLPRDAIAQLGEIGLKALIEDMPTRRVDLHLHRQVLRNANYAPKITDLEDWAGVGVACCYCDVVVCEKHMSDMLKRNKFSTKARIEVDLEMAVSGP